MGEASDLRKKLALLAQAKQDLAALDLAEHLALPLGERLQLTLEWSDALIRGFPKHVSDVTDDEAATWARVHARLHRT